MNILLTGAGAPGGPGIIKALKSYPLLMITAADANPEASGRFLCENFELIPKASDPDFIDVILRICEEKQINIIFPLVTKELFHFAKNKTRFQALGIKVIVSDEEPLNLANNKRKLYEHLQSHQIAVPEFYKVNTVAEFKEAASKLDYPHKPFCFKPSVGNGSRGFRIVSRSVDEFDLLFHHKPNVTFMSFEKAIEILESQSFPELLVTEYLPGEEYTVDTIIKNGKPFIILPRLRSQMRDGISIGGTFVNEPEIINYCKQIIESIPLHGPIGIQVKKAVDGSFKILEVNPRIQGTSVAAMGLKINLPLIAVMQEFDMEIDFMPTEIAWGTKFLRYYEEVFYK